MFRSPHLRSSRFRFMRVGLLVATNQIVRNDSTHKEFLKTLVRFQVVFLRQQQFTTSLTNSLRTIRVRYARRDVSHHALEVQERCLRTLGSPSVVVFQNPLHSYRVRGRFRRR